MRPTRSPLDRAHRMGVHVWRLPFVVCSSPRCLMAPSASFDALRCFRTKLAFVTLHFLVHVLLVFLRFLSHAWSKYYHFTLFITVRRVGNLGFLRYSRISFGIKGVVVKKVCWNIPWNIEGSGRQICMPKEKNTIILQILGVDFYLSQILWMAGSSRARTHTSRWTV